MSRPRAPPLRAWRALAWGVAICAFSLALPARGQAPQARSPDPYAAPGDFYSLAEPAVDVRDCESFARAMCNDSVATMKLVVDGIVLNGHLWPRDLPSPCSRQNNLTIVGALPDGRMPILDFYHLQRKVAFAPYASIVLQYFRGTNFKYGGGGDFDIMATSPNAVLWTVDFNKHSPYCLVANPDQIRALPKPPGHPRVDGWNATFVFDNNKSWCEPVPPTSTAVPQCWSNTTTIHYDHFATFATAAEAGSDYVIAKINATKTCDMYAPPDCVAALGGSGCLQRLIDAMLAPREAAWLRANPAVADETAFFRAMCDDAVDTIRLTASGIRLLESSWPPGLASPCARTRNLTVRGDMADSSAPVLDFYFLWRRLVMGRGTSLTIRGPLVLKNYKLGGSWDLDLIAQSPGSLVMLEDVNKNMPICSEPSSLTLGIITAARPGGFPEYDAWRPNVTVLPMWCQPGTIGPRGNSSETQACWNSTLFYDEYLGYPSVSDSDAGEGYVMGHMRTVRTCDSFVSNQCSMANGADACIRQGIQALLDQDTTER